MKHFTTEEWIDFVNHVTPQKKLRAMREHLSAGCRSCEEQLALWQKVRSTAGRETNFQPPESAVHMVRAAYVEAAMGHPKKRGSSLVQLMFDSFLQPAQAGARSSMTSATRQMLYRADSYQIDLQIESRPGSNLLVIIGQMMDLSTPEMVSKGVPVMLSNYRESPVHAVTNEFGEFRCEIDNSGDLELCVPGRGEEPITISLRNALGGLSRERV
jgi:hypothetical protein